MDKSLAATVEAQKRPSASGAANDQEAAPFGPGSPYRTAVAPVAAAHPDQPARGRSTEKSRGTAVEAHAAHATAAATMLGSRIMTRT